MALKAAVMSRDVPTVQALLKHGADVRDDVDAFEVVLNFGDSDMAALLLRHGANANMTRPLGTVFSGLASLDSRISEVPQRDLTPERIDETVKRLRCDIAGIGGESLLHLAVRSGLPGTGEGRSRIAELLLEHKADPNAKSQLTWETPLMHATSQHDHDLIKALMKAGADPAATDRCGRSALDYVDLYPRHQRAHMAAQTRALLQTR